MLCVVMLSDGVYSIHLFTVIIYSEHILKVATGPNIISLFTDVICEFS